MAHYTDDDLMMPLEYMLQVMRDEGAPANVRLRMAEMAAPYCHQKATEDAGDGRVTIEVLNAPSAGAGAKPLPRLTLVEGE